MQTMAAFVKLGNYLRDFCENYHSTDGNPDDGLMQAIYSAEQHNGWFTRENILFSLQQWGDALTEENLTEWLSKYDIQPVAAPKTIGIVMAGNIPLVGFHDFICVLLSGNRVLAKLSSNDKILLPFLTKYLVEQEPALKDSITFVEGKMEDFDAVIATGSNNTSRYFEYYFGKKPNIIRKNRNSVAILTGNETKEELMALGEDIFRYYGLGCRNVSKIFVPKDYDFEPFFNAIFEFKDIINEHKYANNYDYNKAVYLMSEFKILDNGFLVLKEDESLSSPISALFYTYYEDESDLRKQLNVMEEEIQCVVSAKGDVPFGATQKPKLNDYADGVDTLEFLLQL
ncbi:Acyl-CoA reductase (LuxC) [Flagellimonas zhangzhouensis]|uniref:Acyl-CoA reductase (LuxC) n=2 Tax=Flagellimonas zhangzhouensis TaxID=1073328 RepID=A0A1H2SQG5_9FLAO|nr:acyl-CoA reductase [Allomuricauda zhangzhouensis]SDQ77775.1 Acyl-CoA reductase (LuxC) [Allomuricauda zhangzhouensis]SDW33777.1 Acyl-CoA reductase (LuxC) [Allomuricauda zhangzhouensis]